jgi:hypothetical protein
MQAACDAFVYAKEPDDVRGPEASRSFLLGAVVHAGSGGLILALVVMSQPARAAEATAEDAKPAKEQTFKLSEGGTRSGIPESSV